jgi:hypothetical protein
MRGIDQDNTFAEDLRLNKYFDRCNAKRLFGLDSSVTYFDKNAAMSSFCLPEFPLSPFRHRLRRGPGEEFPNVMQVGIAVSGNTELGSKTSPKGR